MTKRNPYILAALASAIAPNLSVVAVHDAPNLNDTGLRKSIETSVALDADGTEYDIAVAGNAAAGKVLRRRALAAKLLERAQETQGLNIRLEKAVATGDVDGLPVTITRHLEGTPLRFDELDIAQCASLGTAIATVHLLETDFLLDAGYPRFTADGIRSDLAAWVTRLDSSPEVPLAIVDRWKQLVSIDALWQFAPVVIHGDFQPNDILFRDDSVRAIRYWENIQVSDPARDFTWAYEDWVSDQQRDAILSAYGRMMGSRMDARIVPRARLWRQMDIVRELLQALDLADRAWIRSARERVEKLASILNPVIPVTSKSEPVPARGEESSTITVGTLLADADNPDVPAPAAAHDRSEQSEERAENDDTNLTAAAENSAPPQPADPLVDGEVIDPELEALRAAATDVFANADHAPAGERPLAGTQAPAPPATGRDGDTGSSDGSADDGDDDSQLAVSEEIRTKRGYVSLDGDDDDTAGNDEADQDSGEDPAQATSENEPGTATSATTIVFKETSAAEAESGE